MKLKTGKYGRYENDRRGGAWKRVILLALLLAAVFFAYRQYVSFTLGNANAHLADGALDKAESLFAQAAELPFTRGRGHDGLAAIALLRDDFDAAKTHIAETLKRKPSKPGGDPAVILDKFLSGARCEQGAAYRDFLKDWLPEKKLKPYYLDFAALSLGMRDLKEAADYLEASAEDDRASERGQRLETLLEKYRTDGAMPVLLDRHNTPILSYDLSSRAFAFDDPKLFAGWTGDGIDLPAQLPNLPGVTSYSVIQTTLDVNLQRAAYQAMSGYEGTIVIAHAETGDVLAAYGTEGFNPFSAAYEPGSVVKVLTYALLLREDRPIDGYAPKRYPGQETIGGKVFYDWTTQGQLDTIEEGMAVSCNLMFARMGIDLGWPKLKHGLERVFDGQPKPRFWGEGAYGHIVRDPAGAWELGRAAIGLDFISATSLGLAVIPLTIANDGAVVHPRLVRALANIEGLIHEKPHLEPDPPLFDAGIADKLRESMRASVEMDRGTARRAQSPNHEAALKTGTAGDRPFNSVMIGLLPADTPKLAFAFFLYRGGKCEINGAKVAKNLQEQISALAPEYLED